MPADRWRRGDSTGPRPARQDHRNGTAPTLVARSCPARRRPTSDHRPHRVPRHVVRTVELSSAVDLRDHSVAGTSRTFRRWPGRLRRRRRVRLAGRIGRRCLTSDESSGETCRAQLASRSHLYAYGVVGLDATKVEFVWDDGRRVEATLGDQTFSVPVRWWIATYDTADPDQIVASDASGSSWTVLEHDRCVRLGGVLTPDRRRRERSPVDLTHLQLVARPEPPPVERPGLGLDHAPRPQRRPGEPVGPQADRRTTTISRSQKATSIANCIPIECTDRAGRSRIAPSMPGPPQQPPAPLPERGRHLPARPAPPRPGATSPSSPRHPVRVGVRH